MSDRKENPIVRLLVIAAFASIAVLPLTIYGCGPEWARWDATQANMYFRRGETEDALYQLRDAIRKSPRDPVLKLTLAERLIELGQQNEALELANQVLEVFPDNAKANQVVSFAYQKSGDFKAALDANIAFYGRSNRRDIQGLNTLAYFRALANTDLNLAKEDSETVVKLGNRYVSWTGDDELNLEVKATVLAAMVSRCCDSRQDALDVISPQIDELWLQIRIASHLLTEEVYQLSEHSFPVRQTKSVLERQMLLDRYERRAAALLSCRALLHQDLEDTVSCDADRREVVRLGFDSSEIVNQFLDERTSLGFLGLPSAFLDTRGYISSLLPWDGDLKSDRMNRPNSFSSLESALRDLNIAILCSNISFKCLDFPLGNAVELNEDDKQKAQKERKQQLAVLLYHRMTLHQRAGNDQLASMDEKRILDLGYEPGPNLF